MLGVAAGVLALGVAAGALAAAVVPGGSDRPSAAVSRATPTAGVADGLAVLAAWDRRRAAAWAGGDPAALRALYTRDSRAGRRDRAALAAYADRGLRVVGLRSQLLAGRVVDRARGRLVLRITDRLARATAVGAKTRVVLPAAVPRRREIVLRRSTGRWRVASVRMLP